MKTKESFIGRITCMFPEFSLQLFDDSDFHMESSARFPEIDASNLLEMGENNQNKYTQRRRKT